MIIFPSPKAGLHFGKDYLSFALVKRSGKRFRILDSQIISLSPDSIRHSPVEKNLVHAEEIRDRLKEIFLQHPGIHSVSLSLPDLSSRMILIEIKNRLPPSDELNQVIKWNMEQKFILKIGESRFSHQIISQSDRSIKQEESPGGPKKYIQVFGTAILKEIISEYESLFQPVHWIPKTINSASLNIFNIYKKFIQEKSQNGHYLFLSLVDSYFTLMVFESGLLQYIRTVGLRPAERVQVNEEFREDLQEAGRIGKIVNHLEGVLPYHFQTVSSGSEICLFVAGLAEIPKALSQIAGDAKLNLISLSASSLNLFDGADSIVQSEKLKLLPAIAAAAGAVQ